MEEKTGWAREKIQEAAAKLPRSEIVKMPKKCVKRMIAVVSAKGGVGKSSITGLLACELARRGGKIGVFDADLTGATMPHIFGVKSSGRFEPVESRTGVKLAGLQLLLKNPDQALVWRGPLIAKALQEVYTKIDFGELDWLIIDSPPGTSDVPLSLYQTFPLDGIVLVTSPQELVHKIVERAENMARVLNVPILGIVENLTHMTCKSCGKDNEFFGIPKGLAVAERMRVPFLGSMALDPALTKACDDGKIESYSSREIKGIADKLLKTFD